MRSHDNRDNNYAYLMNVDPMTNANKFYEITQNKDYSIDVHYGVVGGKEATHHFAAGEKSFKALVTSRLNMGFKDVTALHSVKAKEKKDMGDLEYEPIPDTEIKAFIDTLITASKAFMEQHYTIEAQQITKKMLSEIQGDINDLVDISEKVPSSVYEFNEKLKELLHDSQRKMDNVADCFAQTEKDFERIIEDEQLKLDALSGIYADIERQNEQEQVETKKGTVLDAYGLSVSACTYKQEDEIIAHLGADYAGQKMERRFIKAYAVENEKTRAAYDKFREENHITDRQCRCMYHGSKTENWFAIMKQGLSLNPDAKITGKMFGQGLYFADEARKSANYMDCKGSHWNDGRRDSGYMAVYDVALGKMYEPNSMSNISSRFSKKDLKGGCLSVFANKHKLPLQNDEYIVYDQSQCTVRYLVELSHKFVRDLEHNIDRHALRNQLQDGFDKAIMQPTGDIRIELQLAQLPDRAYSEFAAKVIGNTDVDRLYFDYKPQSDRISISCLTGACKEVRLEPDITKDDYKFLQREMKKAFAESEKEWKGLIKSADRCRAGEIAFTKNPEERQCAKEKNTINRE